jgi:hypothetical protein
VERGSAAYFVFWGCETVALYGANELLVRRFGGGLVRDQDPTEIGDDQASDARNVDFDEETLTKRLGRVAYNPAVPVGSKVWGLHRYYGRDGANGKFLLQAGTAIYEDNGAVPPVFSSVHSGLTGGKPVDFVGWKERVYAGNGQDGVRRRKGDGGWASVALLAAPSAPGLTPLRSTLETFDSDATHAKDPNQGWVATGGNFVVEVLGAPSLRREGTNCLKLNASSGAPSSYVRKRWSSASVFGSYLTTTVSSTIETFQLESSAGLNVDDYLQIEEEMVQVRAIVGLAPSTLTVTRGVGGTTKAAHTASGSTMKVMKAVVDLSEVEFVSLWVYSEKTGVTFQVGVRKNDGALDFADFASFETKQKKTWVRIRVPLATIPPAERTASPGLGIKFGENGGNGYPVSLYFDDARPEGPLVPDHYFYYATYAETETHYGEEVVVRESNPSPAAELDVSIEDAMLGVTASLPGTAASGVNQILLYRRRRDGPFERARLVTMQANPGAGNTVTYLDTRDEGELAVEDAPELVQGKIDPPVAKTYAVANGRLVAGHAQVAGEWHPWRLYLSRLGYPEEFGGDREPTSPHAPGWLDIAARDHIRRLVEFDGQVLVFCDRAIYTLEGSGWDDFTFRKRADVGLDARGALAVYDRFVFFLAGDGVRVLAPNRSFDGLFETWVVSEPVDSVLRSIPAAAREQVVCGLDERGRLHLSYTPAGGSVNSEALVFDPTQGAGPGGRGAALTPGYSPTRPGWTQYSNWGFSCFCTLKRGGGDAGQLVGGDPATVQVHYLHRDRNDTALQADSATTLAEALDLSEPDVTVADGSVLSNGEVVLVGGEAMLITGIAGNVLTVTRAYLGTPAATHEDTAPVSRRISWHWQGKAQDAGPGAHFEWVFVGAELDAAAGQSVTATPVLEGTAAGTTFSLALGAASTGFVSPLQRCGAAIRGRFSALKLSGTHGVRMKCRSARMGMYLR